MVFLKKKSHTQRNKENKEYRKNNKNTVSIHTKRAEFNQSIQNFRVKLLKRLQSCSHPSSRAELKFFNSKKDLPNVVCKVCKRMVFIRSSRNLIKDTLHQDFVLRGGMKIYNLTNEQFDNLFSDYDTDRICNSCNIVIRKGKIPRLAVYNGLDVPKNIPDCVKNLNPTEQYLLRPYNPYLRIEAKEKFSLYPQYGARGAIVHVQTPVDFYKFLPMFDANKVYGIIKRNLAHKTIISEDEIDIKKVKEAFEYLIKTPLYKDIEYDREYFDKDFVNDIEQVIKQINNCGNPESSNENLKFEYNVNEQNDNETDNLNKSQDTSELNDEPMFDLEDRENYEQEVMVVNNNNIYVLAPSEGKIPQHWSNIPNIVEYVLVTIFGGNPAKLSENVKLGDWIKCLVDNVEANCRSPFALLYLAKLYIERRLKSCVSTALRKGIPTNITAGEVMDNNYMDKLMQCEDAFYITRKVRPTPAYLKNSKNEALAMVRQLGIPTFFITFSPGEGYWVELLQFLMKRLKNKDLTLEQCYELNPNEKAELIQQDAATCTQYFYEKVHNVTIYNCSDDGPFEEHPSEEYFIRVEFQLRGSPHIHEMSWHKNAPKYDKNDKESIAKVCAFVDRFISCRNDQEAIPYTAFQYHKHKPRCRKGQRNITTCRYGFPRFPMKKTTILEPLPEDKRSSKIKKDLEKIQTLLEKYCNKALKNAPENIDDMLKALEMSYSDYLIAIQSSISKAKLFLQRRPVDIRTNNYNPKLLMNWEGNMDIQFILHEFGVVSYMTEYVTKDETGQVHLINQVVRDAILNNKGQREVYNSVVSSLINANFMGAQEAYCIIKHLPMVMKSRSCIFINTDPLEEQSRILKSNKDLTEMDTDDSNIFKKSLTEQYMSRVKSLENVCFAYYAAKYAKHTDIDEENDLDEVLKVREKLRIIRYSKVSVFKDPLGYLRRKVVLFYPWRNMKTDIDENDIQELYESNKEQIEKNSSLFSVIQDETIDEYLEECRQKREEERREDEEQFEKDLIPEEEQYNPFEAEYEEEEKKKTKVKNSRNSNTSKDNKPTAFEIVQSPVDEKKLSQMLDSLNDEQRKIVMHFYNLARNEVKNQFVLLIGPAGTGKSFVIETLSLLLTQLRNRTCNPDSIKVVKVAFTGKAAFLINGTTINSTFQTGTFKRPTNLQSEEFNRTLRIYMKDTELGISDEASMISSDLLDKHNLRLQYAFYEPENLFGGINWMLAGDFRQLRPVDGRTIFELSGKRPKELSHVYIPNPLMEFCYVFELTTIERQKGDSKFSIALSEMGDGKMSAESIKLFEKRMVLPHQIEQKVPKNATFLFSTNIEVNKFNILRIEQSPEPLIICEAKHDIIFKKLKSKGKSNESDTDKRNLKEIEQELKIRYAEKTDKDFENLANVIHLKIGIRYMVIRNIDVTDGLYNGAVGTLNHIEYESDKIKCLWIDFGPIIGAKARSKRMSYVEKNQLALTVAPIEKYSITADGKQIKLHEVCRNQFPVVPAEAMTIHKSQGMTFDTPVCLDMRKKLPREHQYVGCSRVKTIENLYLIGNQFYPTNPINMNPLQEGLKRIRAERPLKLSYETFEDKSGLVISYQNIQGYYGNFKRIMKDPWYLHSDIIIFSETNIVDKSHIKEIPGYTVQLITLCPPNSRGKGILIYAKQSISMTFIDRVSTLNNKEYLDLNLLKVEEYDVYLLTGYCNPTTNFETFDSSIKKMCYTHLYQKNMKIFIGDFNFNVYLRKSENFLDCLENKLKLKSVLPFTVATTFDRNSQIDVIFSNYPFIRGNVYRTYISDHDVVHCEISKTEFKKVEYQNVPEKSEKLKKQESNILNKVESLKLEDNRALNQNNYYTFFKNTVGHEIDGVKYTLIHMCSFNAVLHGLIHSLKYASFTNYLLEFDPNFHTLLQSFSENVTQNSKLLIEFLLAKNVITRPNDSNELTKDMVESTENRIGTILLRFVISLKFYCNVCCKVIKTIKPYVGKHFTMQEIQNMEQVLKSYPKRTVHCNQPTECQPQPIVIVQTTGDYNNQQVNLNTFPKTLKISDIQYKLSFIVAFVPGHFVTYCLKDSQFLKYDDLYSTVSTANDNIQIKPRFIFYIQDSTDSHESNKRQLVEPSTSRKKICNPSTSGIKRKSDDQSEIDKRSKPINDSNVRIILKNTDQLFTNERITFIYSNMCGFNSLTHGLKYTMSLNATVRSFMSNNPNDYFKLIEILSNDPDLNFRRVHKYFAGNFDNETLRMDKFRVTNTNNKSYAQKEVDMFSSTAEILQIILPNYASHTKQCSNCHNIENEPIINVQINRLLDLQNLENTVQNYLNENFPCTRCQHNNFNHNLSPLIFIDPIIFFTSPTVTLIDIPSFITINHTFYDLVYLVPSFPGHFKCYFKIQNNFAIIDDTKLNVEYLKSDLHLHNITPNLLVYVQRN
jgi:PIF1-like helicase/Helitron helicase-like domain at N-terminus